MSEFDMRDHDGGPFIHPSAVVAHAAQLGRGVQIGPFCTVGPDVVLEEGRVRRRRVLEIVRRLVGQALLQRREEGQRGDRQRDGAREDQRGEQPRAQTEGPAPDHCSRKR